MSSKKAEVKESLVSTRPPKSSKSEKVEPIENPFPTPEQVEAKQRVRELEVEVAELKAELARLKS